MAASLYDALVTTLLRGRGIFDVLLDGAAAHASARGIDPSTLIDARPASAMYTLVGQVQSASDAGKLCAARLAGVDRPSFADTETSFTERRDRIARTVALLESSDHAAIEAGATPPIPRRAGGPEQANTGSAYQLQVAVSNFVFHVTTADDILRHNGVALGKVNFLDLS